jgi:predicted dehydrogenase
VKPRFGQFSGYLFRIINNSNKKMTTARKIRWAILGAGRIARVFVKDFVFVEQAELVAVAARDKTRAAEFAAECHIPQAMNYEELYAAKDIDAVYIATTHNFHFEQAMACIQHGKHVLCEKPITVNPTELNLLIAAAAEHKVFLMEALWSCFMPAMQRAKDWIKDGKIGALKIIQSDFSYPAVKNDEGRLYNPKLAGGSLLDIGIYPISICSMFTETAPRDISAMGVMANTGVDETCALLLNYGGITASLFSSVVTRMSNTFYLYGEKGSIEMFEFWKTRGCSLFDSDHQLIDQFDDGRPSHGFAYQIQDATNGILAGRLQSEIVPLHKSLEWQNTMMEVRRQLNFRLPNDDMH